MLKINDIIEVKTNKKGECFYNKEKINVTNALPEEKLLVRVVKINKKGIDAKIDRVINASPYRTECKCSIYDKCGGCALLHMKYSYQLAYKKAKLAKKTKLKLHDVVASPEIYHYRNKIILGFKMVNNKVIAGLYEEDSHRIVGYNSCLLHDEISDNIVKTICKLIMKYHLTIYDEDRRVGLFRHVMIRKSYYTNQYMVVLVVSSSMFPGRNNFVKELRQAYPMISTIVQNVNKRATSIVLQDEERILFGKGYIEDMIDGKKFRISSRSFFQINLLQAENLYRKAISLLDLKKNEIVLDAYCGTGTIGICASEFANKVMGVELNKQAVVDAIENAKINNIKNIRFYHEDATKFMIMCAKNKVKIDALIMDPTREGSTYAFIQAINKLKIKKVVYISCNPDTQLRDIEWFKQMGYSCNEMFLFDMFCHSNHLESVVLLTKEGK